VRTSLRRTLLLPILVLAFSDGLPAIAQESEPKSTPPSGLRRAAEKEEKVVPTEVLPAQLQLTVYELQTTPEYAARLDAKTLTSSAATPESLLGELTAGGKARILYRIDQPVNVISERIQNTAKEGVVTASRMTNQGQTVNTISYQNVGLLVELSSAKPANAIPPNVAFTVDLATMTPSDKEVVLGHKAMTSRNLKLKHSAPLSYGQPAAMLTVSSASPEDATAPMVYVIRYLFSAPAPK